MNAPLPAPLTPHDCDRKDFPGTLIYRHRLRGSAFNARATDSEWRAGLNLWLNSQDQVPAGSLPNSDVELCRLADLGRDLKQWRRVKVLALHGWFQCADGRLYHRVVADVVNAQWQAMSVPFGGGGKGKQNWIENEFDRMERFERIYIATDMDKPGHDAAAEIASRLGRHRCYRVTLPRKDANECLVHGIAKEEIAACVAEAQHLDPEGLRRAGEYENRVVSLFWPAHETHIGYSVPYAGLNGRIIFRPGEVTLWSGATGSGKSQLISDCVPCWIREGSRVCLASFEMKPEWTLKRMLKQTGGGERPTPQFIGQTLAFLDSGLLLYEKVGKSDLNALLEIFAYAHAKYGCDQFVIDSLVRLGIAGDDYNAQEQAVFRLVDWTIAKNVHLHLVAHARKAAMGQQVSEAEDVKGAMEIAANAFNIISVWRNRKIEDENDADNRPDMTEEPGVTVNIAKQRNGDFEGKVKLYFNTRTYQYFSPIDNRRLPRCYVTDPVERCA